MKLDLYLSLCTTLTPNASKTNLKQDVLKLLEGNTESTLHYIDIKGLYE